MGGRCEKDFSVVAVGTDRAEWNSLEAECMGRQGSITGCNAVGRMDISLGFRIIPDDPLTANCGDNIVYNQIIGTKKQIVSGKRDVPSSAQNFLSSREF